MNATASPKQESGTGTALRAPRPRYVLVRQGEGPNRKWVWQLAAPPAAAPSRQPSARQ